MVFFKSLKEVYNLVHIDLIYIIAVIFHAIKNSVLQGI